MTIRRVLATTLISLAALVFAGSMPAGAVDNPDYSSPPPSTVVTTPPSAQKVTTAVKVAPVRTRLAITGSDATSAAVIGGTLIALGAGAMAVRRRKLSAV